MLDCRLGLAHVHGFRDFQIPSNGQIATEVLGSRSCFLSPGKKKQPREKQTRMATLMYVFVKGTASRELLGIVHSSSPTGTEGLKRQFVMEGSFHKKTLRLLFCWLVLEP